MHPCTQHPACMHASIQSFVHSFILNSFILNSLTHTRSLGRLIDLMISRPQNVPFDLNDYMMRPSAIFISIFFLVLYKSSSPVWFMACHAVWHQHAWCRKLSPFSSPVRMRRLWYVWYHIGPALHQATLHEESSRVAFVGYNVPPLTTYHL